MVCVKRVQYGYTLYCFYRVMLTVVNRADTTARTDGNALPFMVAANTVNGATAVVTKTEAEPVGMTPQGGA